jgi:hypothetical protein
MRGEEEFRRFDYAGAFIMPDRGRKALEAICIGHFDLDEGQYAAFSGDYIDLAGAAAPIAGRDGPSAVRKGGGYYVLRGPPLRGTARVGAARRIAG